MMGLLVEEQQDKSIVLLDGTSSAGKSHTLIHLNAVPYYESNDPNRWVIIATDDFSGTGELGAEGEERRLKLDHPNIKQWAKENEDSGIVSGIYRKDGKDVPENPYEGEYIQNTDQDYGMLPKKLKQGLGRK